MTRNEFHPPNSEQAAATAFPCTHRRVRTWAQPWTPLPRPGEKPKTKISGVLQGMVELGISKPNPAETKPLRKSNAVSHSSLFTTYKRRAVLGAACLVQFNQLLKSQPVPEATAEGNFQPPLLPSLDTPLPERELGTCPTAASHAPRFHFQGSRGLNFQAHLHIQPAGTFLAFCPS